MTREEAQKLLKRRDTLALRLEVLRNKLTSIHDIMPIENAAQRRMKDNRLTRLLGRIRAMRDEIDTIDAMDIFDA